MVVNVAADGLNVRRVPNGYPLLALMNGTPVIVNSAINRKIVLLQAVPELARGRIAKEIEQI
jgi:hypothetical protein